MTGDDKAAFTSAAWDSLTKAIAAAARSSRNVASLVREPPILGTCSRKNSRLPRTGSAYWADRRDGDLDKAISPILDARLFSGPAHSASAGFFLGLEQVGAGWLRFYDCSLFDDHLRPLVLRSSFITRLKCRIDCSPKRLVNQVTSQSRRARKNHYVLGPGISRKAAKIVARSSVSKASVR